MVYDFVWPVYVGDAKGDTLAVFSPKENSIHNESLSELKCNPEPLIVMWEVQEEVGKLIKIILQIYQ